MKFKKRSFQCDPEGFYFHIKGIPFCTPPQKNFTKVVPIYESIMDQFDNMEDRQNASIKLVTYNLLCDKHQKFSGILAIEIHSN